MSGMSRAELWGYLANITPVESTLLAAYENEEEKIWREGLGDSPHGHKWSTSFHACLAGDTEVVTRYGIHYIKDLMKGDHELLIPALNIADGTERRGRSQRKTSYKRGHFEKITVSNFGIQKLYGVEFKRGRQKKTVYCTRNHRWHLKDTSVVETKDLEIGNRIKGIRAVKTTTIKMVPFAVAQGFVFGDGTARTYRRDTAWLDLHHNGKDEAMLKFFQNHITKEISKSQSLMKVTQIQNLPRLWKKVPSFEESSAFLLSWLSGYFAADGSISDKGQSTITSASIEAINFCRGILSVCGIGYGKIKKNVGSGIFPHGAPYEDRVWYTLNIDTRSLPKWFYQLDKHRERYEACLEKDTNFTHEWEINLVWETNREEEVFCATVPSSECFALSDELLTGNSSFPGDDPSVCGRAQVYKLMDPPPEKPHSPKTRALFDEGSMIEHMFVKRWSNYGVLLSADVTGDDEFQTGFEDSECWLTGSPDAIILPPFWNKGHVLDVKTTSHEKVIAMRADPEATIYSHKKYIRQIKAYIAEANKKFSPTVVTCEKSGLLIKNGEDRCASFHNGQCIPKIVKVLPPDDGTLFYSSREEPLLTASYYISNDDKMFEAGRKKIKSWKDQFIEGILPEHVRENEKSKWSVGECAYCDFKKNVCKLDHKNKIKKLEDSELLVFSKNIRPSYNYQEARSAVFRRWGAKDPLEEKIA